MLGWLSFIICLGLSCWLIVKYYQTPSISKPYLILGFGIKLAFAISFILVFSYYFSDGILSGDSVRFLYDGNIINAIFYESPSDFFKLLLGLPPTQDVSLELMQNTTVWSAGPSSDWFNDNRLIVKMNAIIRFFSFGNIYVHALVFSFLSFTGIFLTYKAFQDFVARKVYFWFALICLPNLAFWSSSLLKESILILGFGIWCWSVKKIFHQPLKFIVWLFIAGVILVSNKPYAGLIIIIFTSFLLIGKLIKWSKKGLLILTGLSLMLLVVGFTMPNRFNLTDKISSKQNDLNNLAKGGIAFVTDSSFCVFPYYQLTNFELSANDSIQVLAITEGEYKLFGQSEYQSFIIQPSRSKYSVYLVYAPSKSYHKPVLINHSSKQLLKNTFDAILNVFLKPFPSYKLERLLNFAANILLLLIIIIAFIKRRSLNKTENYLVAALLFSAFLIALIIGWSVPIFGAIVRYKIPVELLLLILAFIIIKPKQNEIH
ncbi:MAG: hypothetical protein AB8B74_07460 [Crocinitomicaceae bacterium]